MKLNRRICGSKILAAFAFFTMISCVTLPVFADYPLVYHKYSADPTGLEYDGQLYLYCSNDTDNNTNGPYAMHSITCISSDDLKNWTDHGEVLQVPRDVSWATYSWAPSVITNHGLFYMYFANNAGSIGVATSSVPTGPFIDAKGGPLIDSSTPGAYTPNQWYFDPCIFVDSNQAYLYFGGHYPTNARVILLDSNMTSIAGTAIPITAPNFFEASYLHKRGDTYYFSYSSQPSSGLTIQYETSSSPVSGFTSPGTVLSNPPYNAGNNNHQSFFTYEGVWYCAYHNRYLAMLNGLPTTYKRNVCLDRLYYITNGVFQGRMQSVVCTSSGLTQLKYLNPYHQVEAETMAQDSGIATEVCSEGGMDVSNITDGSWIKVIGVDFGSGASTFYARVACPGNGGNMELHLDSLAGTLIGTCPVSPTGGWQTWTTASCSVAGATGVHDLYLKFIGGPGSLFNFNWWQFQHGSPLQITGATYNADSTAMTLVWNSTPPQSSQTYTLQKKNSLADPTWTTVTADIPSGGSSTTNADNAADGNAAFYRISSP